MVAALINEMSKTLIFLEAEKKKVVDETSNLEEYDEDKKEEMEQRFEEVNQIMQSNFLLLIFL